jgi:hypothetical protein
LVFDRFHGFNGVFISDVERGIGLVGMI